jgi:hypothetical protein
VSGTFYLPYRHHYSHEQLLRAYPAFPEWVKDKQRLDPTCLFSNGWFEKYGMPFWEAPPPAREGVGGEEGKEGEPDAAFVLPEASLHREASVAKVVNDPVQWRAFKREFLVNIFHLHNNESLAAAVAQAVYRAAARKGGDAEAYACLTQSLARAAKGGLSPLAAAIKAWHGVNQVHRQRHELLRQVCGLHQLSMFLRLSEPLID